MGDRPRPAGAPGARNSRAAWRPGLRGRHGPGAIGQRVRHQGPFDGTGVAGRHRRRRHDPRSHFRSPQGAGPGSWPAEDRFRSRLSPARELDPSAARGGRTGLFIPDPHIRITAAEQFSSLITRLIGRAAACQFVRDLVSAYRVVTLTGPGGIGKTSLAIKAVRYLLPAFEDGGWLVELASLSDPGLVPSAVAAALGLKVTGEISAVSVARAVGGRHLLLVLDNCEHVIDAVANLAETFMRVCPRTTIVATSREVLRIDGEAVYRVPPLEVPAPEQAAPDYIMQYSAVELFVARTKALNASFSPGAE